MRLLFTALPVWTGLNFSQLLPMLQCSARVHRLLGEVADKTIPLLRHVMRARWRVSGQSHGYARTVATVNVRRAHEDDDQRKIFGARAGFVHMKLASTLCLQ